MNLSRILTGIAIVFLMIVAVGCSGVTTESPVRVDGDRTIIVDRTGREWDITHAVEHYGMDPDHFNFGIGVGSIPSVDNPRVIGPGESGYPDKDSPLGVFGVNLSGIIRAYGIGELTSHEVFNDEYEEGGYRYVSVAY